MIRHTVLFAWTDEATEAQKRRAADEAARLPSLVPAVRAFAAGPDVGVSDGNFDFAVSADFDDVAGYVSYRDNAAHRAMVAEHILPIIARRAAVQYEFSPPAR